MLKSRFDEIHTDRKRYNWVKWDNINKTFIVETLWGQVERIWY